jgi:hypothetical protein
MPGEFILSRRRLGVAAVRMPRVHERVSGREEEEGRKSCRGRWDNQDCSIPDILRSSSRRRASDARGVSGSRGL